MSEPLDLSNALTGTLFAAILKSADTIPAFDPDSTLALASAGVHSAQRSMACHSYEVAMASWDDGDRAAIGLVEAICFARMAAYSGLPADGERVMFLLSKFAELLSAQGRGDIALGFEAAALNVASDLADDGNEMMAAMVSLAGDILTPETFAEAKRQREQA